MLMPVLGFGVFVMMQRQMGGLRQRAERSERLARAEREVAIAVPMATHATNGVTDLPATTSPAAS
jgi:hypothetical protein